MLRVEIHRLVIVCSECKGLVWPRASAPIVIMVEPSVLKTRVWLAPRKENAPDLLLPRCHLKSKHLHRTPTITVYLLNCRHAIE